MKIISAIIVVLFCSAPVYGQVVAQGAPGQNPWPVSATGNWLTDAQLRAVAVAISGTVTANQGGTWTVGVSGSVSVTGTFWQATQPISAASLPLPTGAATEATLGSIDGKLPALSGGRIPVVLPAGGSGLTDTELRATPVITATVDDSSSAVVTSAGGTTTFSGLNGQSTVNIEFGGTGPPVGPFFISFYSSVDGTNFNNSLYCFGSFTGAFVINTDLTTDGIYECPVAGYSAVRVVTNAFTSGSLTLEFRASVAAVGRVSPVGIAGADGTRAAVLPNIGIDDINGLVITTPNRDGQAGEASDRLFIIGGNFGGTLRGIAATPNAPQNTDIGLVVRQAGLPVQTNPADNTSNTALTKIQTFQMVWDGSTWDRAPGNSTDGMLVNLGANNDVVATATNLDIRDLTFAADKVDASGSTVTATATNLDIRDLTFAADKVDASGSTLGANSGVDIGDVTINNPTLAVTGTFFQATQPVSIAAMPSTPVTGTFFQATQPVSATNLDIRDLTFAADKVDVTGSIVKEQRAATPTVTSVADSAGNITCLASNANRLGATIFNDSTSDLYIKLGATASTTSFTVKVWQDGFFTVPFGYTGIIDCIWSADTAGSARVTEVTQ